MPQSKRLDTVHVTPRDGKERQRDVLDRWAPDAHSSRPPQERQRDVLDRWAPDADSPRSPRGAMSEPEPGTLTDMMQQGEGEGDTYAGALRRGWEGLKTFGAGVARDAIAGIPPMLGADKESSEQLGNMILEHQLDQYSQYHDPELADLTQRTTEAYESGAEDGGAITGPASGSLSAAGEFGRGLVEDPHIAGRFLVGELPAALLAGGPTGYLGKQALAQTGMRRGLQQYGTGAAVGAGQAQAGGYAPNLEMALADHEGDVSAAHSDARTRTNVESAVVGAGTGLAGLQVGPGWRTNLGAQMGIQGGTEIAAQDAGAAAVGHEVTPGERVLAGAMGAGMAPVDVALTQFLVDSGHAPDADTAAASIARLSAEERERMVSDAVREGYDQPIREAIEQELGVTLEGETTDPSILQQLRQQRETDLAAAFADDAPMYRRGDMVMDPETGRPEAITPDGEPRPVEVPGRGQPADTVDVEAHRRLRRAMDETGAEVSPQDFDLAVRDLAADREAARDPAARAREIIRDYDSRSRAQAFGEAHRRREAADADSPRGRDYQPGGRPHNIREGTPIMLSGVRRDRQGRIRDGRMVQPVPDETGRNRLRQLTEDGPVEILVRDVETGQQRWEPYSGIEEHQTPTAPRREQDFMDRATTRPRGVGTELRDPDTATDRIQRPDQQYRVPDPPRGFTEPGIPVEGEAVPRDTRPGGPRDEGPGFDSGRTVDVDPTPDPQAPGGAQIAPRQEDGQRGPTSGDRTEDPAAPARRPTQGPQGRVAGPTRPEQLPGARQESVEDAYRGRRPDDADEPPAPREPEGQTVGEAEQQQGATAQQRQQEAPAQPQQEPESGALREAMQQVSDDRVDAEIGRARRDAEQQTEARVRSGTDDDQLVQRQREEGQRDLGLARRAEEGDPDAREYFRARAALQQDAKERAGRRRDMTPEQIEQDVREVQDMLLEVESLRQRATGERADTGAERAADETAQQGPGTAGQRTQDAEPDPETASPEQRGQQAGQRTQDAEPDPETASPEQRGQQAEQRMNEDPQERAQRLYEESTPEDQQTLDQASENFGQGGTQLYSGIPVDAFARAIGRNIRRMVFGNDERVYRRQVSNWVETGEGFREWADQYRGGQRVENPLRQGSGLRRFGQAMIGSADGQLRVIADRYDSGTLRSLADAFHATAGRAEGVGRTFSERHSTEQNTKASSIQDITDFMAEHRINDRESQRRIIDMVEGERPRRGREGEAARRIEQFYQRELDYQREAGVRIGEAENYFSRHIDTTKLAGWGRRNSKELEDRFIRQATKAYREIGYGQEAAGEAAALLHRKLVHGDTEMKPGQQQIFARGVPEENIHPRKFTRAAAKHLSEFRDTNISRVLSQYAMQSTKRAEIARTEFEAADGTRLRFGDRWENWNEITEKMRKEGVVAEDIEAVTALTSTMAGVQNLDANRKVLQFSTTARTMAALMLLDRVALSTAPELFTSALRASEGNALRDVGRTLETGVGHIGNATRAAFNTITGSNIRNRKLEQAYELAEDMGIIAGDAMSYIMQARFLGDDVSGRMQQQIQQQFFKNVGLTQLNDYTRVQSVRHGHTFMRRMTKHMLSGKGRKRNQGSYFLRELGIPSGRETDFARWMQRNGFDERMPAADDLHRMSGRDADMAELYRTALTRFADQSVMRPDATTRPRWANHPLGAVVFSLLNFTWAFQKNILNRWGRIATSNELSVLDRLMLMPGMVTAGTAMYAAAYAGNEVRDILNEIGDDTEPTPQSDMFRVERAANYAGFAGKLDPLLQMGEGLRYQRAPMETAAGPFFGTAASGIEDFARSQLESADTTNTAERNAAEALHQLVVQPAAQAGLAMLPGWGLPGAVNKAAAIGGVRSTREPFVEGIAGEEDPAAVQRRTADPQTGFFERQLGIGEEAEQTGPGRDLGRDLDRNLDRNLERDLSR